jgi:Flp pilus assembly protein TadG
MQRPSRIWSLRVRTKAFMESEARICHPADEKGQSIVELALVTPLLLVVLFAVIEFGFYFSYQMTLTNAARDGARVFAAPGGTSAAALAAARASVAVAMPALSYCSTPTYSSSGPTGTLSQVGITISCTYTPVTPLAGLTQLLGHTVNLSSTTLTASAVMRAEQ